MNFNDCNLTFLTNSTSSAKAFSSKAKTYSDDSRDIEATRVFMTMNTRKHTSSIIMIIFNAIDIDGVGTEISIQHVFVGSKE